MNMKLITPIRSAAVMSRGKRIGTRRWGVPMQPQGDRSYAFDINNLISDGLTAYTASGWAQAFGAQGIIDLGGNQGLTVTLPTNISGSTYVPQQARIDAAMMIEVTAITQGTTNLFKIIVVGSNSPSFTSAAWLGSIELGLGASMDGNVTGGGAGPGFANTPLTTYGGTAGNVYEVLFTNEQQAGVAASSVPTKFEYLSLYNVISGTTPSITYKAFMAVLPEP
jgi:hypothetical protein